MHAELTSTEHFQCAASDDGDGDGGKRYLSGESHLYQLARMHHKGAKVKK
ncbi:hypothetical protein MO867_00110 [Microbulbifer sp. OS29]|uniref:Uncharacterized protein n=1 Tax=Microbulbifer okhotskensis TaxID=2926617 RepID=A0A9X2J2Q4_9GAMM|nr:hypothetical protein [Microbulbifer okhotskensis]MCO1332727.1 hypothetical protein [Microbulbifer okhotskensis]